ncbi:MAG: VOC family protein [Rhizobacter sp.]|nr:VOC family protein [Rhizobacter sp.]
MPAVNTIHEVFAYLCVPDTQQAIGFYTRAFGAVERYRLTEPSGRIGHAELQMGPSAVLMLSDQYPEYGITAPPPGGLPGMQVHLHVDDADAMAREAVAAGATMLMEPTDMFYGERACKLRDPFGHTWLLGHSIETLTPQEMQRRYTELMRSEGSLGG